MAYIQGANPFSRRRGKAKREAKRQLKSLYKQGYYQPTRVTEADGTVSYKAGGPNEGEQKLNRQARRDIRREARGEDMGDPIQNYDQKGHRTTELVREGINRMSSSPLHQDEYDWEVESGDPRTGGQLANVDDYVWDVGEYGDETREKMDDGRIKVQQTRNISGTHTGEKDDEWWGSLSEEQKQFYRDRQSGKDTRTRYIDPAETVTEIIPEDPEIIPTPTNDPVIPVVPSGPTPTEEQIQIGKSERRINEKVPVTTTKDVERRKPGMQKVCTNWEWVERGSGQGERRSDAGPRPTQTVTKTKTRMRRI